MLFGLAIEAMKMGAKVAREGWNGKDMWISMTPGKVLDLEKDAIWTENIKNQAIKNGGTIEILPYISMKTADNNARV